MIYLAFLLCGIGCFCIGAYIMSKYAIYSLRSVRELKDYRFFIDYDWIDKFNIVVFSIELIFFLVIFPFIVMSTL